MGVTRQNLVGCGFLVKFGRQAVSLGADAACEQTAGGFLLMRSATGGSSSLAYAELGRGSSSLDLGADAGGFLLVRSATGGSSSLAYAELGRGSSSLDLGADGRWLPLGEVGDGRFFKPWLGSRRPVASS